MCQRRVGKGEDEGNPVDGPRRRALMSPFSGSETEREAPRRNASGRHCLADRQHAAESTADDDTDSRRGRLSAPFALSARALNLSRGQRRPCLSISFAWSLVRDGCRRPSISDRSEALRCAALSPPPLPPPPLRVGN